MVQVPERHGVFGTPFADDPNKAAAMAGGGEASMTHIMTPGVPFTAGTVAHAFASASDSAFASEPSAAPMHHAAAHAPNALLAHGMAHGMVHGALPQPQHLDIASPFMSSGVELKNP